MKIDYLNDILIIYLKKDNTKIKDFTNLNYLEGYLQDIVLKLKNIYNIAIFGFYNIKIYIDKLYGIVLEMERDADLTYLDINQVEMRIIPVDSTFLYQVDDLTYISYTKLYLYHDNYYLKVDKNIPYKTYLYILENSKIIYKDTDKIIKYGRQINDLKNIKSVL